KPAAIVALGATAARSLFRRPVTIAKLRGRMVQLPDGIAAFVTIHPSFLLRIRDGADKEREYRNFVADLRPAAQLLANAAACRATPYSSSVTRPLTSAASASSTSAASRPLASTVIVVPGPAASIMRPMIEVPPTVSWPRLTFTSASNFSTVCTNLAEARACRPFLLQISSTRVIGAESAGRLPKEESCTRPRSLIYPRERDWRWGCICGRSPGPPPPPRGAGFGVHVWRPWPGR